MQHQGVVGNERLFSPVVLAHHHCHPQRSPAYHKAHTHAPANWHARHFNAGVELYMNTSRCKHKSCRHDVGFVSKVKQWGVIVQICCWRQFWMSHLVGHTDARFNDTLFYPQVFFCLRKPICLRVDPACIKPKAFFFSSVCAVCGPPSPGARLWPQEVGWWSQQGLKLRHISMRELESLQLEGQRRTSPSLCEGGLGSFEAENRQRGLKFPW